MVSSTERTDEYNLPRHTEESSRLDAQHEAYVKIIGFTIHPRIASALPEHARIADIGTGTGAWLLDVAKSCPATWTLQGFDMSDAQFPQHEPRLSFDKLNILGPIPHELQGRYDLVHLRLLVCGLARGEWELAARNVLQMLKPGGFVQWHESQFRDLMVYQSVPGVSLDSNKNLIRAILATLESQGKMLDDVLNLHKTVQAEGFSGVEVDCFSTERVPAVRRQLNDVQYKAVHFLGRAMTQDPRFGYSVNDVEAMAARCLEELKDEKAYYQWTMRVVTGQRPF